MNAGPPPVGGGPLKLSQLNSQPFPHRLIILDFCGFQVRIGRDEKVGQREDPQHDDDGVRKGTKGPEPDNRRALEKFSASGHPETVFKRNPGLHGPDRQQGDKGHQKQPAVETPEGQFQDAVLPVGLVDQTPPRE